MSDEMHALVRTSPTGKGQKFIGVCTKCGEENLTFADMGKPCPNVRGIGDKQALAEILDGPKGRH